jgi:hypothetical protein
VPQSPESSSTQPSTPPPPQQTPNVWADRITGGWHQATGKVMQILPVDKAAQTVNNWFRVDETQVAEILCAHNYPPPRLY